LYTKPLRHNLHIFGVEGVKVETKGIENQSHGIITENLPNLGKDVNIQIQKAFRTPNMTTGIIFSNYFMVKMLRVQNKGKILKAVRQKHHVTCKASPSE
jgi:hypothetical protein